MDTMRTDEHLFTRNVVVVNYSLNGPRIVLEESHLGRKGPEGHAGSQQLQGQVAQTGHGQLEENNDEVSKGKHELDVDPPRDDDASPMSTYRCMLRPT